VSIINGVISKFGRAISAPDEAKLNNLTLTANQTSGAVLGDNAQVVDSKFIGNPRTALAVGKNALVTHCTFASNGLGLSAGPGAVVTENVAANNGFGFNTNGQAKIAGNAASSNVGPGFLDAVGGSTFEGNTASFTRGGLALGDGFDSSEQDMSGKILGNNMFLGNSALANHGQGFGDAGGSTFQANTSNGNGGIGFTSQAGVTYVNNTCTGNGDFGFSVECPSNLVGNTAEANIPGPFSSGGSGCNRQDNLGF
jgi:hypothetical protein